MGTYFNPTSMNFRISVRSEIYIDKSELIVFLNRVLNTERRFVCVSRPRRFGKSMAVNMLSAYYGCGEDTDTLFRPLKISKAASYREHLNQYHVVSINIQNFLSKTGSVEEMLTYLQKQIVCEIRMLCPDLRLAEEQIDNVMQEVFAATGRQFVILIDEWDCLFRVFQHDTDSQKKYLDFLRLWLKDRPYVALAYMTGILPIKKYGTHSALNMFYEYSMSKPGKLAPYFGFTTEEVKVLCEDHDMDFTEAKEWYDGYTLFVSQKYPPISIYNPRSIVEAMLDSEFGTYWNQTETYEALMIYLQLNFDGLKDAVITMLAGDSVEIDMRGFQNDMTSFHDRHDVLTLLVHLGYLTYDACTQRVRIPNKEVQEEWVTAVKHNQGWGVLAEAITASEKLLQSLWDGDAEAVAEGIDKAHQELSMLQYNDENALSYTVSLAFYAAREYYTIVREFPSGKGFADLCFLPKPRYAEKPAMLIELKWDKSAKAALDQIKKKEYAGVLSDYRAYLLLAGINYEKGTKRHECRIEWLGTGQKGQPTADTMRYL